MIGDKRSEYVVDRRKETRPKYVHRSVSEGILHARNDLERGAQIRERGVCQYKIEIERKVICVENLVREIIVHISPPDLILGDYVASPVC